MSITVSFFLKEIGQTSAANNVKEMLFLPPVDHSKEDLFTDGCGSRSRDLHKDVLQLGKGIRNLQPMGRVFRRCP